MTIARTEVLAVALLPNFVSSANPPTTDARRSAPRACEATIATDARLRLRTAGLRGGCCELSSSLRLPDLRPLRLLGAATRR